MNIYVANIPYVVSEDMLRELFEQHGSVESVKIVLDRETQRSRGFGFVEMSDETGRAAIDGLDGHSFHGRELKVNEARPRPERY
jgi:RNA recognition motif-containing protein